MNKQNYNVMRTRFLFLSFFLLGIFFADLASAENEERELPSFSEISMRISGTLYIEQGSEQRVRVVAKPSALEDIITEVKGRNLNIRFKSNTIFRQSFSPGKVEIYITVPEVDALSLSGSGDIIAREKIQSRILDLTISGSGDIALSELDAERVNAAISGSGDILVKKGGIADELSVVISGSGNVESFGFEAKNADVKIVGSGSCNVNTNGSLKARIAGSGNVYYKGNPQIDTSVLGSGKVKKR